MEEKQLCGYFKRQTDETSRAKTWTSLENGNFKKEIECLLITVQIHTKKINYVKAKIDQAQQNSNCRLCCDRDENINYMISKCSNLVQRENKTRHDWVGKGIHWK